MGTFGAIMDRDATIPFSVLVDLVSRIDVELERKGCARKEEIRYAIEKARREVKRLKE